MAVVILTCLLLALGFVVWWLLIATEGAYLSRRVVIALYDMYAGRYDRAKQFDERADILLLSEPLLWRLRPQSDPLILDVATGTGRFPLAMAANARFEGHVIGIDLSRRMLAVAARKIAEERYEAFITLLRHDAMRLPFPDAAFDAVACLEALEFLPNPQLALREMVRVLRPGGALLTTIRVDTRWMPGRARQESEMRDLLESLDMTAIEVETWQSDYDKVWALKAGASAPVGPDQRQREIGIKDEEQVC